MNTQNNNNNKKVLTIKDDVFFGISTGGLMLGLTGEKNTKENQINALQEYKTISNGNKKLHDFIDFQLTLLNSYDDYLMPIPLIDDVEKLFYKLMESGQLDDGIELLKNMSYYIAGTTMDDDKETSELIILEHFIANLNIDDLQKIDNLNKIQKIRTIMSYNFILMITAFKENHEILHDYFDNIIIQHLEQDKQLLNERE